MPDLAPVDYQPDFPDQIAPQGSLAQQVSGFPQRAADMAISALGPLGEAGMTVGDWLRTGGSSFDTRDIAPVAAGVMLGTAAPEAEEGTAAADAAQAAINGIRAFHGSPYDFDKFDLSKIGAGEGAQAYGHGLYFAENPAVASDYKDRLAPVLFGQGSPEWLAANRLNIYGTPEAAVKSLMDISGGHPTSDIQKAIDLINSGAFNPPKGKMYEVNIAADPEQFLDWDKPLSEQSPKVQEALAARAQQLGVHTDDIPNDVATAEYLRSQGIPGIKYLDQGSRSLFQRPTIERGEDGFYIAEDGRRLPSSPSGFESEAAARAWLGENNKRTHNYVVFDPSMIDIIKKYGIAGLIAGGAAHFKTTPVDHQPQFTQ